MSAQAAPPMASDPIVSVLIAAWNAAGFLEGALDSVLAVDQGVALEVVVADDASTDATADLVAARAAADPRLRLVRAEANGGPSAARNLAIAAARGRWLAVLDADDRFLPGRLARMVAFAEARDADLAFDMYAECDAAGQRLEGPDLAGRLGLAGPERWDLVRWVEDNRMLRGAGTGYLKPLIRAAFLARHGLAYREELRNSEDYALVAEILARGGAVWVSPETGYLYTRREGSISHRIGMHHLTPLIAFANGFRAGDFDPRTRRALTRHAAALEDAAALTGMIEALKARAPLAALTALAKRPGAWPLAAAWTREVIAKRLPG